LHSHNELLWYWREPTPCHHSSSHRSPWDILHILLIFITLFNKMITFFYWLAKYLHSKCNIHVQILGCVCFYINWKFKWSIGQPRSPETIFLAPFWRGKIVKYSSFIMVDGYMAVVYLVPVFTLNGKNTYKYMYVYMRNNGKKIFAYARQLFAWQRPMKMCNINCRRLNLPKYQLTGWKREKEKAFDLTCKRD
jgi:hypothetical protein